MRFAHSPQDSSGASSVRRKAGPPAPPWAAPVHLFGNNPLRAILKGGSGARAKLEVGSPGDPQEAEADRMADRVMRMPAAEAGGTGTGGGCGVTPEPPSDSAGGGRPPGGRPLGDGDRTFFEARFGRSFAGVRVHAGRAAHEAARSIEARAFTRGSDIVFGEGEYRPDSAEGRRLLAHELTHVVQAGEAPGPVRREPAEPARPKTPASDGLKFSTMVDGQVMADPQHGAPGRSHGITLVRRGKELFYRLPGGGAERQVPRPPRQSTPGPAEIDRISWGTPAASLETAISVAYDEFSVGLFHVKETGLASFSTLAGALATVQGQQAGGLEVFPAGLEMERTPGVLANARPRDPRFATATRYHVPPAGYSLYLFPDHSLEIADDASGKRLWRLEGRHLRDFRMQPGGVARVAWDDSGRVVAVELDIRRPMLSLTGLGALSLTASRNTLVGNILGIGVDIREMDALFTDEELQAAWDTLQSWPGPRTLSDALQAQGIQVLTLVKDPLLDHASFDEATGEVRIPADVEAAPGQAVDTITHEVGHALLHAAGLMAPRAPGAAVPAHVTATAQQLLQDSAASVIDEKQIGAPTSRIKRTRVQWESALSTSEDLNEIWAGLHRRFPIPDVEATGDIRGLDVADESRYRNTVHGESVGHGYDNVGEFVASFIATSRQFQPEMAATIRASGSRKLASLYLDLWVLVNRDISRLPSPNPYSVVWRATPP